MQHLQKAVQMLLEERHVTAGTADPSALALNPRRLFTSVVRALDVHVP
jgi:hypothetical protein